MAINTLIDGQHLTDIADATRVLVGSTDTYLPSEIADEILDFIPDVTVEGNPIHITDAAAYPAESVVTTLEPVQDLHGYDKPWAGGTGKNLLNVAAYKATYYVSVTESETSFGSSVSIETTSDNTYRSIYYDFDATSLIGKTVTVSGHQSVSDGGMLGVQIRSVTNDNTFTTIASDSNADFSMTVEVPSCDILRVYISLVTATGIIGAKKTITNLQMELGSTATAYEPYSNECPISGHTGVELTRAGKNLFDGYIEQGGINTSTGQTTNSNIRLRTRFIKVLPNTTYSISTNLKIRVVCEYDTNSNYLSTLIDNGPGLITATITTSANATYIRFVMMIGSSTPITPDDFEWGQIELGSTATAYEPYRGETHSVTFPQEVSPVYGCEVDWVNGVLRVTKANIASYNGEILPSVWISDRDVYAEGTTPSIGAQVVYELATPLEIPLTPEVITLLKCENNIWTDSGTSEIEYKVDLSSYIQKLIDEASANASLSVSPMSLSRGVIEPESKADASEDEGEKQEVELGEEVSR